jgi:quinone-modifying oxidoreductase subunit QmoA
MWQASDTCREKPISGRPHYQLYKYFPKMCYPTCGLEINLRRLKASKNIRLITMAEVSDVAGEAGNYKVSVTVQPRYINENCFYCLESF